ncbi:MAG: FAD/NAD(P)-binding oxidoreductase, partial [Candidatus Nanopelagicales bacterium]|nr:FAD/NAD(P)-binding oxidoreductase [Candidatus Nanopelagicales bacterium]
ILIVTAAPLYKCPAAPYEAALLTDALMHRTGRRGQVSIAVHAAEPGPMGTAGPTVSAAVKQMLSERGIEYRPEHQLTEVRPDQALFTDGDVQPFDLLVYMPAIKPPAALMGSGVTDDAGWATANRNTLATTTPGVWAIGDNTQIPLGIGKPLPRAGVFAHAQAHAVADAIADQAGGRPASGAKFDGRGGCFIEVGHGRAGYGSGDFFAEPAPAVTIKRPARHWHLAKAAFEKNVMFRWL